jgi:hypothetical protein
LRRHGFIPGFLQDFDQVIAGDGIVLHHKNPLGRGGRLWLYRLRGIIG